MFVIPVMLMYLATNVKCVPLMNIGETLPRTEVLEIVSPNQLPAPQQNITVTPAKINGTNICMTKG